jgi:tetratricopeptide (TPR) repeat protein
MRRDPYAQGVALSAANRHAEAIDCFEEALEERPGDMGVLFALGNTASALGLAKPAEAFYRQVLALDPARLEALVNLANLLRAQGQFEAAEALLAPACRRNPDAPELWLTLGSVYREAGDAARAAAFYRQALSLRPDYPQALGNLADILADEGQFAEALALHDRAIAHDPGNAQARLNRAIVHLLSGRLSEGWTDYAARLEIAGRAPKTDRRIARWTGGNLAGMRLLVTAEQGIGDQIMFASLIPELAARAAREGGSVILECEKRLVPLFSRSFPRTVVYAAQSDGTAQNADAAIPSGSLSAILRTDFAQFPIPHRYLAPDAHEMRFWREELPSAGRRPWIGVCWRSGKTGGGRSMQYAPLIAWADFLRGVPGSVISVQYDASAEEIYELEKLSGRKIFTPKGLDQKNELDRTCALFATLDAVVSAPTAVSWLAAATGVPTAKILFDTSWTAFGEPYEPFAPAGRLMMPAKRGDWADAFAKARAWIANVIAPR